MADKEYSEMNPDELARFVAEQEGWTGVSQGEKERMVNIPGLGVVPLSALEDPGYMKSLVEGAILDIPVFGGLHAKGIKMLQPTEWKSVVAEEKKKAAAQPTGPLGPETSTYGRRPYTPGGVPGQPPAGQFGAGGAGSFRVSGPAGGLGPLSSVRARARKLGEEAEARGEETREGLLGDLEEQKAAAGRIEEQKGVTAGALAQMGMERETDIADIEREHAERIKRVQAKKDAAWDKFIAVQDQLSSAEVDPTRYFQNGGAAWAAFAVAFGAIGQAFQQTAGIKGAKNQGVVAMMKAIDNDIAAQEAMIDKLGLEANVANNVLARWQVELGDAEAAKAAAKISLIDQYKRMADIAIKQGQAAMSSDAAKLVMGELEMERAKLIAEIDQRANAAAIQALGIEESAAGRQAMIAESRAARAAAGQSGQFRAVGGLARNPEFGPAQKWEIQDARKFWKSYQTVRDDFSQLIEWRDKHGFELPGEMLGQGMAVANHLIVELKMWKEMGAHFTESEEQLLQVPRDPGELSLLMKSKLDTLYKLYQREKNNYLSTNGWIEEAPFQAAGGR